VSGKRATAKRPLLPTGGIGLPDVPADLDADALLGDALAGGSRHAMHTRALAFVAAAS
jgi:hypothetical protein